MIFDTKSSLVLTFEIAYVSKPMVLSIEHNNNLETFDSLPSGLFYYRANIQFPSKLTITVSGKTIEDTLIDINNNIIKDTYIKLVDIEIDNLSCEENYVYKYIKLNTTDGQVLTTNYWGFNGIVELDFFEKNSFYWALKCATHNE